MQNVFGDEKKIILYVLNLPLQCKNGFEKWKYKYIVTIKMSENSKQN